MNDWSQYEDYEAREEERRDAKRLRDVLAESTTSDVGALRLALAEILVKEDGVLSYGACACAGGRGCSGHITEVTKMARAALGLAPLPDRERVPLPPHVAGPPPPPAYEPLAPDGVRPLLLGKTISALHVHTDEVPGAISWIALDFADGEQVEISAYAMHGMEAGIEVYRGTRIRDIYEVVAS